MGDEPQFVVKLLLSKDILYVLNKPVFVWKLEKAAEYITTILKLFKIDLLSGYWHILECKLKIDSMSSSLWDSFTPTQKQQSKYGWFTVCYIFIFNINLIILDIM